MEQLKRVTRIDSIPAGSTYFNEQGFLHDTPIVTSIGIFEYALPDGGVRRELRLPEHVFDPESLSSYNGAPVIITHKAGSIDKTNVMKEIVGTIISNGYQDHDNVRCKIVIHDIDKVKKLPYRELSLGYSLDLIEEPGYWNGEPYDAIQTNIRINHLAIVESARAGEHAHLNLDGKKVEMDDKENKEGGKNAMVETTNHGDSIDMTPEELIEAIKQYRASKEATPEPVEEVANQPEVTDEVKPEEVAETEAEPIPEQTPEVTPEVTDPEPQPEVEEPVGEKKDDNVSALVEAVEKLLLAIKGGAVTAEPVNADEAVVTPVVEDVEDCKKDSSEDMSQSMNNDSADDIIKQKLDICRIGDKLNMDGLENKTVMEGKKAIITKVLPDMRLDGKSDDYINAAYDMAVGEVNKRKGVDYQRQQMTAVPSERTDGNENVSMANSARQRMLEREGGK